MAPSTPDMVGPGPSADRHHLHATKIVLKISLEVQTVLEIALLSLVLSDASDWPCMHSLWSDPEKE